MSEFFLQTRKIHLKKRKNEKQSSNVEIKFVQIFKYMKMSV